MKPLLPRQKGRICFITETDLESRHITGAITNDIKMLRLMEKYGVVNVVHLQKEKYRFIFAYLPIYILQILRSLLAPYQIYFTRSIIASFMLTSFRSFNRKNAKIVHQAFSVPLMSSEIKYLGFNVVESFVRLILYNFFEKKALPKVDFITVAAEEYAEALIKVGIKRSKIHVVHFYVEDAFFEQPVKNIGSIFSVCYVGGFHSYHSLLPLIEAFELVGKTEENVNLLLVGVGPQRPKLEKEVEGRKLTEKVKFLGGFPHSFLPSFLASVDCFVSLIPKSGISISLLEAAASAKVIIAFTPDDVVNRYFTQGESIYLLNRLAPNEIANAIKTINENSKLKDTLAKGARETARRYFSEEVASRQLQTLISKIYEND